MTPRDVDVRDGELRKYVKMRLTAAQLHAMSQSWDFPFPHVNHVWRRIERLGLRAAEEREQLPHRRAIVEVLVKLAGDAKRAGYRLTDVKVEHALAPGVRVDLYVVLEGNGVRRVRVFEVQLSRQPVYLYRRKMLAIKRHRKTKGVEPYRAAWLVEDKDASEKYRFGEVNKVYGACCEAMEDSPNMLLFLVDWLPDFRAQYSVVEEDIFMSNQKRREALL